MLSLVHMMRENTEKLERHEARERQVAEQLKKTITILTKRVSAIDGLKSQLNKLEERISGIEHLIVQVIDWSTLSIRFNCFNRILTVFFFSRRKTRGNVYKCRRRWMAWRI